LQKHALTNEEIKAHVLDENIRIHALEGYQYDSLHPEQYNFFQNIRTNRIVDNISRLLHPKSRILDLGCGTGYLLLRLIQEGFHVTGVDLSQEILD